MSTPLHYRALHHVATEIASGDLSPVDLVEYQLERIEKLEPRLHAFSTVMTEEALRVAREAEAARDRGELRGPLHGVPVAVKDLFDTAGTPTRSGTKIFYDRVPETDATAVARLRAAGAIIVGKLHMSEAAIADHHPAFPTPVNPWNADAWTGASSSGNAVATSAGMCFASLATDTGGSIRFPSACTGLTGLKPTWGRVSRHGVVELAGSLDHVGPMARSARDCAIIFDVIAGDDPLDPTSQLLGPPNTVGEMGREGVLRIGVDASFADAFESDVRSVLDRAIETFQDVDVEFIEVHLPDAAELVAQWWRTIGVEAAQSAGHLFADQQRADFGDEIAQVLDLGRATSALDFQRIIVRRREFTGRLLRVLAGVDAILVPAMGLAAPTLERMRQFPMNSEPWRSVVMPSTSPFNFAGVPSITFPGAILEGSRPVGVQLVGSPLSEGTLLALADRFQGVTDFHLQHPDLPE